MAGPDDETDHAELDPALLEAPLGYPSADSYPPGVIPVQAGGHKRIRLRDVALRDLSFSIVYGSVTERGRPDPSGPRAPSLVPFGETIVGYSNVFYKDGAGREKPWPANKIRTMFVGEKHDGPDVFSFPAPSTDKKVPLLFKTAVFSKTKKNWQFRTIHRATIQAYCAVKMSALSPDEQLFSQILYAEGGSLPLKNFSIEERHAVAWAIRARRDLIQRGIDENSAVIKGIVRRNITPVEHPDPSYKQVITRSKFSGFGDRNFKMAMDPAGKIPNRPACEQLQLSVDIAKGVISGAIPNPYDGQGDADFPGCYFYITKRRLAELATRPDFNRELWDRPTLPPLGSNDRHFYYGMLPAGIR